MVCATRLSQNVLKNIRNYATVNNELFFLEALLPTLAKAESETFAKADSMTLAKADSMTLAKADSMTLAKAEKCCCPAELKTVVFRHNYTYEEVTNKDNIYHPIKDILKHNKFRI
jgi:hypothetical protein